MKQNNEQKSERCRSWSRPLNTNVKKSAVKRKRPVRNGKQRKKIKEQRKKRQQKKCVREIFVEQEYRESQKIKRKIKKSRRKEHCFQRNE